MPANSDDETPTQIDITVTSMPTFGTYSDTTGFTFVPTLSSQTGSYNITGKLSDGDLAIEFYFLLNVLDTAPYFMSDTPEDQELELLQIITYALPAFSDSETPSDVSVVILSMPSFVTFSVDTFTITPTDETNHVGIFTVRAYLSDGLMTHIFSFHIEVTNPHPTPPLVVPPPIVSTQVLAL